MILSLCQKWSFFPLLPLFNTPFFLAKVVFPLFSSYVFLTNVSFFFSLTCFFFRLFRIVRNSWIFWQRGLIFVILLFQLVFIWCMRVWIAKEKLVNVSWLAWEFTIWYGTKSYPSCPNNVTLTFTFRNWDAKLITLKWLRWYFC